jgi:hypothetical protein
LYFFRRGERKKKKKKKDPMVTNHLTCNHARNIRRAYPATRRHHTHLPKGTSTSHALKCDKHTLAALLIKRLKLQDKNTKLITLYIYEITTKPV